MLAEGKRGRCWIDYYTLTISDNLRVRRESHHVKFRKGLSVPWPKKGNRLNRKGKSHTKEENSAAPKKRKKGKGESLKSLTAADGGGKEQ